MPVGEGGKGCHQVQLRSATVGGIHTAVNVAVGDDPLLDILIGLGDADGDVTVSVAEPDTTVVQRTTAGHVGDVAGHYDFALDPQGAPVTLMISWSGTWSGNAKSFTTRALVR